MRWPNRIVLVRHGQSEGNLVTTEDEDYFRKPNHKFALTEKGKSQARRAGEFLRVKYGDFDAYFCSTFRRTRETMALLYPNAKPIEDSRLNELIEGIWHTLRRADLIRRYPEEIEVKKRDGLYHYRPPGGENIPDVETRIRSFLADLRIDYAEKSILIAAHGTWMLAFWRIFTETPVDIWEDRRINNRYKNGALAIYENRDDKIQLIEDNVITE
jgi:2,3-bisphosphoglycerate-dependent phosphoglycerate mutase